MTKAKEVLKGVFVDASTGEVIERELNAEEIKQLELMQKQEKDLQDEAQVKLDARNSALAKLAKLGLTEEEIAAL